MHNVIIIYTHYYNVIASDIVQVTNIVSHSTTYNDHVY